MLLRYKKASFVKNEAYSAEGEGFEPSSRLPRLQTFQVCSFDHSDISPKCCRKNTVLIDLSKKKIKLKINKIKRSTIMSRPFYFIDLQKLTVILV